MRDLVGRHDSAAEDVNSLQDYHVTADARYTTSLDLSNNHLNGRFVTRLLPVAALYAAMWDFVLA
jgi:hypothetical protein